MSRHDVALVPESRCLNCGHAMNAVGTADLNDIALPSPGDVTVCIRCGAVMMLDENLRLRGMSDAEMDELVADTEWMGQIAKMVRAIHFVKHMEG